MKLFWNIRMKQSKKKRGDWVKTKNFLGHFSIRWQHWFVCICFCKFLFLVEFLICRFCKYMEPVFSLHINTYIFFCCSQRYQKDREREREREYNYGNLSKPSLVVVVYIMFRWSILSLSIWVRPLVWFEIQIEFTKQIQ